MPLLLALGLLLLLPALQGRAQSYNFNAQPPQITIAPSIWASGSSYNVTVTNPQGNFYAAPPPLGGELPPTVYIETQATFNSGALTTEDPNVTVSLPTYVSPTQIAFTATVAPGAVATGAPLDNDAFVLKCIPTTLTVSPGAVQIQAPCLVPTITSVLPNVWFAGNDYQITLTGTGFTTASAANAACPMSTMTLNPNGAARSSLFNVNVVSPTEITAQVDLSTGSHTAAGAIKVFSGGSYATTEVDILTRPLIQCTGQAMSCYGTTLGGAPVTVVTGQTISLATTPSADTLAGLPIPLVFASNTWNVGGTNIGGMAFGPPAANGTASSATTAPAILTNPNLNTYWLFPDAAAQVKYGYCVDYPVPQPSDPQCSSTDATAEFNVVGPVPGSSSGAGDPVTPILNMTSTPFATGEWWVSAPFTGCATNPGGLTYLLVFGELNPPPATCTISSYISGIVFQVTNVDLSEVSAIAPNGVYQWVQLVDPGQISGTISGGSPPPIQQTPVGLDNTYPYITRAPSPFLTASDSPPVALSNSWSSETRSFSAEMYLLWNSMLDPLSIDVPIGYISWSINGTANQNPQKSPPWYLAPNQGTATWRYTPSNGIAAPGYGLPLWQSVAINTVQVGGQFESVHTDGEQETQQ